MAKNTKHVGQLVNTQRRVVVVFREIPDEPQNCLVVDTDALPDWMHDDVINAVESPGAQQSANFYEYAQRQMFTDGSNMLQTLHKKGLLQKAATDNVALTPNASQKVLLSEINQILKDQGVDAVAPAKDPNQMDMAGKPVTESVTQPVAQPATTPDSGVINDADLAKSMVAQAEQFEAEATRLKEEAYAMDPSLKPRRGRPAKQPA